MKKSIAIMLVLAIICTLSFTGCGEDSENSAESTNTAANSEGPKVTEAATSAPTAASTKSPETESAQTSQVKPTESAVQTETLATNTPATKPTDSGNTAATTTNPTSGNKTTAPTQAPTQAPTKVPTPTATTQVTNAPNKTPATSTSEPTKAPTTTEPTKGPTVTIDPTKDYSEWGNYGFENLLPAPLPFSELEWVSMRTEYPSYNQYNLRTKETLDPEGKGNFSTAFKEYVESLETYGYTIRFDSDTSFHARKKTENEYIIIRFTCHSYRPLITMDIK